MPPALSDFLLALSSQTLLWSLVSIAAMAATAVALYIFWDLVGRGIAFLSRLVGRRRREAGG